jgi:hypothetical protein
VYLNSIPISEQPFRLICSLPDVIYIGNLWQYSAYSCATSKLGISLLSISLFQVVVNRRVVRKNGSDMKQQYSDHRKTSCQAFIRGVIDFPAKRTRVTNTQIWPCNFVENKVDSFQNAIMVCDSLHSLLYRHSEFFHENSCV